MKIEKVLNLINENIVIDFGHFHFDSAASFLNRYCSEDEEFEPDTWGEEALEKCKKDKDKDKDFVEYDEDEMTSAILSTAPQGGTLKCGDNYALGDMRVPKVLGKIQRRKKKA